ncbi:protein aubergine-like [Condylostylus longicornis]|uniref:protein aubergine-like n=1 Tax=Condylostylus longicornis TaxID=2530218 RepID=UPI00244DC2DD|nr:protein aubergine-like [Condylostylus longicornis]XP_055388317.1 protein aubergine-like [Condylostylus longicornis]XP_055388318.1 protein aubergine-like [Condylostylus longicornis]XP_055388319.1 protein aubergine-like [Condylostylus longicornis]XP_055388320.1 protein aubergine-like [Condylostylus longicornis]
MGKKKSHKQGQIQPQQQTQPQQQRQPLQPQQQQPRQPQQQQQQQPRQPQQQQQQQPRQPQQQLQPTQAFSQSQTDRQTQQRQKTQQSHAGDLSQKQQPQASTSGVSLQKIQNLQATRGNLRGRRVIDADYTLKSRPTTLPTKQGTAGRRVNLQANYFRITETYDKGLNQYHVDFVPEMETKYRKQIISRNKEKFGGYIFDGSSLFTKLSMDDFEFTTKSEVTDEVVRVSVKYVACIHLHDATWLQLFNIIVRRCMDGLKLQLIGRNLFNALNKIDLREFNLEIWPGYITSFRQHEKDILLCCDIIHKVMRHETVLEILRRLKENSLRGRSDFITLAKNDLLGSVVLTHYNNKTYRIDDIDFESNPRALFPTTQGNISYFDYYKRRYNLTITDFNQPLLISRPMERTLTRNLGQEPTLIKLIPELCRATGITDAMKSNRKLMTAMAAHTRINPEQRVQRLQTFQKSLYTTRESAKIIDEFNLKINPNLVEIPGRVLVEPTLVFGNNKVMQSFEWEQCYRSYSLFQGFQLTKWVVIIPGEYCANETKNFTKCCVDTGRKMGFQIRDPQFLQLATENISSYAKILEQACQADPQIIMAFVTSSRADLYSCIKKKLTCDRSVPSQVVRIQTIKRPSGLMSVATKVCVQMNAKLRCAPWTVKMPDNVMCIGFDVCHSTRDRKKSYGALVSSMDVNIKPGIYFSAVSEHEKGTELSNDISLNTVKALRQYFNEHKKLPSIIFFYRDGVGDGQLHQVYEHEVTHVKNSIEKIYNENKSVFKLAYIVVSKRINTRIFSCNGGKGNPQPGTIVDDVITLPQRYDFYLISQSVRLGTVSPTSYNVLFDNTRIAPDRIQDMTYRQTHMYYNYFSTIRVPAVCQYAHKLAFLVGQYLHQSPNALLEKNLYFL